MIVNYDSRVIPDWKIPHITNLESYFTSINVYKIGHWFIHTINTDLGSLTASYFFPSHSRHANPTFIYHFKSVFYSSFSSFLSSIYLMFSSVIMAPIFSIYSSVFLFFLSFFLSSFFLSFSLTHLEPVCQNVLNLI